MTRSLIIAPGVRRTYLQNEVTSTFKISLLSCSDEQVPFPRFRLEEFIFKLIGHSAVWMNSSILVTHVNSNNFQQVANSLRTAYSIYFYTAYTVFYTLWQIPSVFSSCHDSHPSRGPVQHQIIGSIPTALDRTAPHLLHGYLTSQWDSLAFT